MRLSAARALDDGVGHADPARAPHLPADAALSAICNVREGLRFLSGAPCASATRLDAGTAPKATAGPRRATGQMMTREQFRALVEEAIDTIPPRFAREIRNVAIVIEDAPSAELLGGDGDRAARTLLGLYQGMPLTERGGDTATPCPTASPLPAARSKTSAGDEDEIVVAIGETLIHELGPLFRAERRGDHGHRGALLARRARADEPSA